jgi:hypothetical protein
MGAISVALGAGVLGPRKLRIAAAAMTPERAATTIKTTFDFFMSGSDLKY